MEPEKRQNKTEKQCRYFIREEGVNYCLYTALNIADSSIDDIGICHGGSVCGKEKFYR